MHILVTADTLGGVWTYTRELVTGLIQQGDTVTLVSFGDLPSARQTSWMERLPGLDYRPTAFKLEWMLDSEADMVASSGYLESVIAESKPDLLHLSQYYYGALRCVVPRIVVAHSDVISWWMSVHQVMPEGTAWRRWYRHIVTRGLRQASAVVAPSAWMLEQIKNYYLEPALGKVIYNGRTPALFNPQAAKDDHVLSVGRLWDQGKNVALLLLANTSMPVYIIGPDRHPERQSSAFAAEALPPNIYLVPEQSEAQLALAMAGCGIYAATSQYEPFGLAPLEAALSRCAIVASDIPSFRELWSEAAVFFHNDDAASLSAALERLAHDPGMRQTYAERAYERALKNFTAERMVSDYRTLYRSLVPATALSA